MIDLEPQTLADPPPAFVVGLCASDASGLAHSLCRQLGCKAISADDFNSRNSATDPSCPLCEVNGRVWKDPQSLDTVDLERLCGAVEMAREPFVIVEGLRVFECRQLRALLDAAVVIRLPKAEAWARRKQRVAASANPQPGVSDEELSRILLDQHVASDVSKGPLVAEATSQYPEEEPWSWLRLHFEDVLWPAVESQQSELLTQSGIAVLDLNDCDPVGKHEWLRQRTSGAAGFIVTSALKKQFVNRIVSLSTERYQLQKVMEDNALKRTQC